jgi:hypothetical protein
VLAVVQQQEEDLPALSVIDEGLGEGAVGTYRLLSAIGKEPAKQESCSIYA